jgi:molybdate transport system substrate-binding protein
VSERRSERQQSRAVRRHAAVAVLLLALSGCGTADGASAGTASSGSPPADGALTGTLTVFAAASLTDVFGDLGDQLTAANPQLDVRFNFAGSSALATQVMQGAPADVFASADEEQMVRVVQDAGLTGPPQPFAENRLMLVVPRENPAGIRLPGGAGIPSLADVLPADATLAVCAQEVPCGAAAAEVLAAAGSGAVPATYEEDVRAVLTKVELGEVDAGLVYVSDVHAAGDSVLAYAFREAEQAVNRYPVAVLADAPNPAAAEAFVGLVRSEEGQQALADAGFRAP